MTRRLLIIAAFLFSGALFGAATTKVGGSGTTKVGGSGTTKVQPVVAASGTSWVTSTAPGTTATNGANYWLGVRFEVQGSPITITKVGRYKWAGNSATHSIKLFDSGGFNAVQSATIDMSASAEADGYVYVDFSYTMSASTIYCLASQEASGGDAFSVDSTTTTTAVAVALQYIYTDGVSDKGTGALPAYGPVNFKY